MPLLLLCRRLRTDDSAGGGGACSFPNAKRAVDHATGVSDARKGPAGEAAMFVVVVVGVGVGGNGRKVSGRAGGRAHDNNRGEKRKQGPTKEDVISRGS